MDKTLRDQALESVPAESRERLLTAAIDAGVGNPNDPAWMLVSAVVSSQAAALAAGTAATTISALIKSIPADLSSAMTNSKNDLTAQLGQEVRGAGVEVGAAVTAAIKSAADTGAAVLRKAAADLPEVAEKNMDALVAEARVALVVAVRDEAKGALAGRMARSWGAVAGLLLLAAGIGASGAIGAAKIAGHLTPWADPLVVNAAGTPVCGPLRGQDGRPYQVCLIR
ncbi:MAG: hypothetical protein ACYDDA_15175 [Acidiferrobacteraceae bacterium]